MEVSNEVPAKKSKRLTSVVWNHFERVKKADTQYAVCLHCKKKLSGSTNSGTTHLRNHLLRCLKRSNFDVTQILSAKRKKKEIPLDQGNILLTSMNYDEAKMKNEIFSPVPLRFDHEHKREETSQIINIGSVKFDQERSRLDLARMIMVHGYPLAMVDHVGFQVFVKNLQPMFDINNIDAIEVDCMAIYGKEKDKVYDAIHRLHGKINLAVGTWVSAKNSEYICLIAYYIDEDWKLQKKMLSFITLDPSYTDDMLSEVITKSLTEWGVNTKLFSMTFDDCSSHEVMVFRIKELLSKRRPLLKQGELFDVRCVSHLLKSIVHEVMEASRDVILKIRGSIRHISSSQAISEKFSEIAQEIGINSGRRLVLDCPMKWNSTYLMLEAAIEYKGAFCLLPEHDSTYSACLSETEWEWVSVITEYVKFLFEFTNVIIGNNNPTANIFFPEICDMHIQLIEWCKTPDAFLSEVALKMKNKFDVYWSKCSLSLAIAAILDPRFKMKLIEYYYGKIYGSDAPARIKEISDGLMELFDEYSTVSSSPNQDCFPDGSDLPGSSRCSRDKLKGFDKFLHETTQSGGIESDLDKYLEEPVFPRTYDFNILNWWKVHTPRYPILSMMARDILGVPVSTIGPEVAFSQSGRVLDQGYSSVSPDTREALMCGQDWLKMEPEASSMTSSSSSLPLSVETS